ncbi:ATP-binding protein [Clostridium sp. 19966]|uniref:ATP-binding protein n=1 Tax=Clostridium sp. 19966 TaxID=2768166 RepID=UPI0028DD47C3|nr:ATP-binding protein [Clostridium sp. 19966]MDT8718846.1 ATP-binding protein [Clostridium sp. 19966]
MGKNYLNMIIYKDMLENNIVKLMLNAIDLKLQKKQEELRALGNQICSELLMESDTNNYDDNLWKSHIVNLLIADENPFSLACEKGELTKETSLYKMGLRDLTLIKQLYDTEIDFLDEEINSCIYSYKGAKSDGILNKIKAAFESFENDEQIADFMVKFYYENGSGILNRYKAFRYDTNKKLIGIYNMDTITFDDIIGCDQQKKELMSNTEAFIKGYPANNVLLYGDRGTGKSSSIKALINEYYSSGLRVIEISRHQLSLFNDIVDCIRGRGLNFIIFMDDLSFEDFETDYKYLKSVMEGGLELKPSNVLIYATTNRRHIIKENWKDREGNIGDISINEAMQEKLSLVDRFGVTIIYSAPNQNEYLDIVFGLAEKNNIDMDKDELKAEALKWQMWHNGKSGRTARQFINFLLGRGVK